MKIFRPILQIYKKILMAFLREQRNAVPVIAKQIAAINRRKPDYSGYFGTPEGIRTSDLPLRRRSLYPAELQAHMKLWGSGRLPAGCPALRSFRRAKGGAVRNRLSCMESGASPRSGPLAGDALRSVFYPIPAALSTLSEKSPLFLGKILENKRLKKLRFSPLYAIISGCL